MIKRRFTRMDLTQTAKPGPHEWQCVLCNGLGYRLTDIKHAESCVFADAAVTAIVVIKSRPGIVLRCDGFAWLWTSPAGKEYRIEKLPLRWTMFDDRGSKIVERHRLSDIRHWLALNQGVL